MLNSWKKSVFDVLTNHSGCVLICLTSQGKIVEWNPIAEEIYGWRYADVIHKNFFDLCRKEYIELPIKDFTEILAGKVAKNITTDIQQKHNLEKNIVRWNISTFNCEETEEKYLLFMGINITPYKRTEEKILKIHSYLRNIVNNLPHFIFWKDTNSVFLGCNKKFSDSVGLAAPQDIVGKTDYDMPWKEQSDAFIQDDQEIITTGIPKLNYEETQKQKDGSELTVLVSKAPMYDENLKIIGILGIYTDISERKRTEKNLQIAKEEAELANQIKTDFIHNMQHDIRTPFTGIWGLAKHLAETELDPIKKEDLNDIAISANELLIYCNSILDFSRIEAGALPVIERRFELKKLVDNVINMEKPAATFKNLNLSLVCDPALPNILMGDDYRLQRILINLISNAIKFTSEGSVNLQVRLISRSGARYVILQFVVSDTGIGIPHDKQLMIYEKFFRVTPSNKNIFKGQGLGLHIVKQFIVEMDGDIDVDSTVGKGSSFICTLPFKLPHADEIPLTDI